jgi:hypothetical protein
MMEDTPELMRENDEEGCCMVAPPSGVDALEVKVDEPGVEPPYEEPWSRLT